MTFGIRNGSNLPFQGVFGPSKTSSLFELGDKIFPLPSQVYTTQLDWNSTFTLLSRNSDFPPFGVLRFFPSHDGIFLHLFLKGFDEVIILVLEMLQFCLYLCFKHVCRCPYKRTTIHWIAWVTNRCIRWSTRMSFTYMVHRHVLDFEASPQPLHTFFTIQHMLHLSKCSYHLGTN